MFVSFQIKDALVSWFKLSMTTSLCQACGSWIDEGPKKLCSNYDHKTDTILILSILMSSLIEDVADCTNKETPFTHALRTKTSTWIFLFHQLWLLNGSSCGQPTANCDHRSHSTQANLSESKEQKIIGWEETAAFHILQKGKSPSCDRFWHRLNRQLLLPVQLIQEHPWLGRTTSLDQPCLLIPRSEILQRNIIYLQKLHIWIEYSSNQYVRDIRKPILQMENSRNSGLQNNST